MPKELVPAGWVKKPCVFLLPSSSPSAETCGECEREFGWWGNSKKHCMFCGYLFHRQGCTHKVQVQGEFFRQRICSRCHYYRSTAQQKLQEGEEFQCVGEDDGRGPAVTVSLCEETAEVILNWKAKGLKETADLADVEVRKGFSHVHHNAGGNYEPLKSFSLYKTGGQSAYHLKATSALICQLWVEGLKAAGYVYLRMVEQERALQYYSDRNMKVSSGGWFNKPHLPSPPAPRPHSPCSEEWEDLSPLPDHTWGYSPHSLVSSARYPSVTGSLASPFGSSSGYQSDLSLSFCSNIVSPRQGLTVHSLNFSRAPTSSRKPCSLPPTPRLPASTIKPTISLPPTPGLPNTQPSYTPTCPCHFKVISLPPQSHSTQSQSHSAARCCAECRTSCQLALDMQNF